MNELPHCPKFLLVSLCFSALPLFTPLHAQVTGNSNSGKTESYASFALNATGNPTRGQALYNNTKTAACINCHAINGIEKSGPNLDGIADKYPKKDLIHHILNPNSFIQPGYETATILTDNDEVFSGRVRLATKFEVRLLLATGKLKSIKRDSILDMKSTNQSMMPSNLVDVISQQDLSDIVAYLQTLKGEQLSALNGPNSALTTTKPESPVELVAINAEDKFENPVWVTHIPGQPGQLIVLEHQRGRAVRLDTNQSPPQKHVFLDLESDISYSPNQGLMCLVFHPDYEENRRYFVKYEVKENAQVFTTVNERQAAEDLLSDSGKDSLRMLKLSQPAFNHNGGCLAFGPKKYLFVGFGDGGPQKDPPGYSQNPSVLHGSILRLDVNTLVGKYPYAVPSDNPFVNKTVGFRQCRSETWAYGFREPWRFSFDSLTGDLWVGDVGQVKYEEVCLVRKGENHGWNVKEGFIGFSNQYRRRGESYSDPVLAYPRNMGVSVTGGYVYRGNEKSPYYGQYIFGDYESRRIWALKHEDGRATQLTEIAKSQEHIASFGLDGNNNILMVGYEGTVFRLDLN